MTLNHHTFTRIHIDALTLPHINHLERAQPFHLHHLFLVQRLVDQVKEGGYKLLCILLRQTMLAGDGLRYPSHRNLTHWQPLRS